MLSLGPEHAATIAADSYDKASIRQFIFENARYPIARLSPEYGEVLRALNQDEDTARIIERPEDLLIIVAGGSGKHSCWHPTFGGYTKPVTRVVG
jgi:hypothetical protein